MLEPVASVEPQKVPSHVYFIDYLKAICVILVIFTHYEWTDKATPEFVFFISIAVPFFMIITGYNFTSSAIRRNETSLTQMLDKSVILPRLKRFAVPFLLAYAIEIIGMGITHQTITWHSFWTGLFTGGFGPGSYYVPLMIQMLVVFPLVFYCVKKWDKWGVIFVGIVNFIYELLVVQLSMDKGAYRLLLFRYLILIAFGCYYYIHRDEKIPARYLALFFIIGFCYLYAYTRGYRPQLCFYWTKTCFIAALYFIVLFYLLFERFKKIKMNNKIGDALSLIGKASYHIFLAQMVFYQLQVFRLYTFLPAAGEVALNVAFCLIAGLTFYYGEQDLMRQKERVAYLWNWRYYLKIRQ